MSVLLSMFWNVARSCCCVILAIAAEMLVWSSSIVLGLLEYSSPYSAPQRKKSHTVRSGEQAGHRPLLTCSSGNTSKILFIEWRTVESNHMSSLCRLADWQMGWTFLPHQFEFTVRSKNTVMILRVDTAHHTPSFWACKGVSTNWWRFSVFQYWLSWELMWGDVGNPPQRNNRRIVESRVFVVVCSDNNRKTI
jgi:hypothetical protein